LDSAIPETRPQLVMVSCLSYILLIRLSISACRRLEELPLMVHELSN
jgi:hypothetical protein